MKFLSVILLFFGSLSLLAKESLPPVAAGKVPQDVASLWEGYDPRVEPLEVEVVREWEQDGLTVRYLRYRIGTFKGKAARMAAFYAFPKKGKDLPGVIHIHGGGQRASLTQVVYFASKGYAALSVNWGGKEMERAKPGDLNTDWGSVDPTQKNVQGYSNLLPGEKFLDAVESPRNCNWFLLTLGCRRGLTFLEKQPIVDADRLGVFGHSMGGNLTIYVAGSDKRVKVASPSVGGSGFRLDPYFQIYPQIRAVKGDRELYRQTMGYQNYAKRITAPVLHLGATNDFHGLMDATYATGALLPNKNNRYVFAPHFNHRFNEVEEIARPLWIDVHLQGRGPLPKTPRANWALKTPSGIPHFKVMPDTTLPVAKVSVFYSEDGDPRSRFFRDAQATETGKGTWEARLPKLDPEAPLFAFAHVYYDLPKPEPLSRNRTVEQFCLSSNLLVAKPEELKKAGVKATAKPSLLIDDFKREFHDWYSLNGNHQSLWQHWTRKVTDAIYRGPDKARLSLRIQSEQPNSFVVVLQQNTWRAYRGKKGTYVAVVNLKGGEPETIRLSPADFKEVQTGTALQTWAEIDELGLCAKYQVKKGKAQTFPESPWKGPRSKLIRLEWEVKDQQ
jgi:cephalosporin-C deacetylase-like acetyl esterase|tara:strand:- start:538 stop:2382 length:1845 start_codon:yes stop_codon:yes gene_type:complete